MNRYSRIFVLLCLGTVTLANIPFDLIKEGTGLQRISSPLQKFGILAGLDTRWEIFSKIERYHYQLQFFGDQGNNNLTLLNGGSDSTKNTFWKLPFDFREENFILNIYSHNHALNTYLTLLCKSQLVPIASIRLVSISFKLPLRSAALESGGNLIPMQPQLVKQHLCR